MDFVDRDRRSRALLASCAAAIQSPSRQVVIEVPDDRRGARRHLGGEGERVGLVDAIAVVTRDDVVLVDAPWPSPGTKPSQMPDLPRG